jgi:hypothetical protein
MSVLEPETQKVIWRVHTFKKTKHKRQAGSITLACLNFIKVQNDQIYIFTILQIMCDPKYPLSHSTKLKKLEWIQMTTTLNIIMRISKIQLSRYSRGS